MADRPTAKLLEEIRSRYDYCVRRWQYTRDQGAIDMKYISGDPWPDDEKNTRSAKDTKRPMLVLDEVGQFLNQLINSQRMTKTSIKVDPRGDGATDKSARYRADQIRQIEYRSKAQQAHLLAFTGAVERSYGFSRIVKKYVSDDSDEQDLWIKPVSNPDTILVDPDFEEPDASDIKYSFELDQVRRDEFPGRFKGAKMVSFSPEQARDYPQWIGEEWIQIVKYSRIEVTKRVFVRIATEQGEVKFFLDEVPDGKIEDDGTKYGRFVNKNGGSWQIVFRRPTESKKVMQYVSNGVEILETIPWDGKYIPIGCCFGKQLWVKGPTGSERRFMSLIRLARDAVMGLNYCATSELEIAGQLPKTPWVGYIGQFEGQESIWNTLGKIPRGYAQSHAFTDEYPQGSGAPLPLPQRNMQEPALQQLEMLRESFRRAIQAAMGITALPTAAQRQNQKSGVALEKIETQQAQGSYHFVDNFNSYKEHMGRMLDDLLGPVYDTEREIGMRAPDDSHYMMKANTEAPYVDEKTGEQHHYQTGQGDHDVSISVGPNVASEREQAVQLADNLASPDMLMAAIQGNPKAAKIVSLAIRLRNGGPLEDELAEVIDPDSEQPPVEQMKQALQEGQQKLQQAGLVIQELQQKADTNQANLMGKKIDAETRKWVAALNALASIRDAEIKAGIDSGEADASMLEHLTGLMSDADKLAAQQAHELNVKSMDQEHERGMQAAGVQATADQADAQRQHEISQAASAQGSE